MKSLIELITGGLIALAIGALGGHFIGHSSGYEQGYTSGLKVAEDSIYNAASRGYYIKIKSLILMPVNLKDAGENTTESP